MKILIIALPRTGSTSLLYKLAKDKKLKPIFEPFDGSSRELYNTNDDNVIVKTIISHHTNNLELITEFNEIILLNRRNFSEHLESHSYQTYFKNFGYNSNNKYIYKKPPTEITELCKADLIKWKIELENISKKIDVEISYYEDLFDLNSVERLRLNESQIKML